MTNKEILIQQCSDLNLSPKKSRRRKDKETGEYYYESTNSDLEDAIREYYINKYEKEGTLSPFIKTILKLKSPMLALQIKHTKPEVQEAIWQDNSNWIFQEKIDGCRCLLCYDKQYGFDFYSRGKNEGMTGDRLPLSYKTRLVVPQIYQAILDKYNINSFIVDTELVPVYKEINNMNDGTELVADTQQNLVTSILGSLDALSHKIQETNPIKFIAFDLIFLNGSWLIDYPLEERDKALNGMITILKSAGLENRIEKVASTRTNKEQFYNSIIAAGGEGVVAKDLTAKYDIEGKRHSEWTKIKRSVSQSLLEEKMGDTIDAFISGFKVGNEGTNNENRVAAFEFSVYLTDDDGNKLLDDLGNPIVHHIATVSGLTDELKNQATEIDEFGQVKLASRFYGVVATIDGQDISSKNYRFAHAVFKGWRFDRDSDSCTLSKTILHKLVL